MEQYIPKAAVVAEIKRRIKTNKECMLGLRNLEYYQGKVDALNDILSFLDILEVKEIEECEKSEYGYLRTEYIIGEKPQWNIGDVLAYYICTSNEEGERIIGKIANIELDDEEGWIYTFEDEGASDEQSLIEEGVYKKN